MRKRVVVAMSGGVDSSVAAALLVKKGFEVIGITMCFGSALDEVANKHPACCGWEAVDDAKKVAAKLGIRHYVLNFAKDFKKEVIDNFIKNYANGLTPNPCVRCNQFIKFDKLLNKAKTFDADFLATGHYAQVFHQKRNRLYFIKKASDSKYDQSYFLWSLRPQSLKNVLFPLGHITKGHARILAKKFNLPVAEKASSQDVCFGQNDYRKFLKSQKIKFSSGPLKLSNGEVVGSHKGIGFYTVGQREGLGVALGRPYYVNKIDKKNNTVYIGPRQECNFCGCIINNINNFVKETQTLYNVLVQVRYNHQPVKAKVEFMSKFKARITFDHEEFAVAPGQSAVVYKSDKVLLGGIISQQIR